MAANKFPPLELEQPFPFGTHKGEQIADVIAQDPGYLIWLRDQRWKDDPMNFGADMEDRIHELLDHWIGTNRRYTTKDQHIAKQMARVAVQAAKAQEEEERDMNISELYAVAFEPKDEKPEPEKEESIAGWGAWG